MLADPELVLQFFGVEPSSDTPIDLGGAEANTAPTDPLLVVRDRGEGREAEVMRWGLVPPWAKDKRIGARLINARSETAATKNSFRKAFRERRCLIAVDGFYEWDRSGSQKLPWRIVMDGDTPEERGRPYALAGLWERWKPKDGDDWLITATILTTEANALVGRIHDRMPVILGEASWEAWLDPDTTDPEAVQPLLRPCDPAAMAMFRVDTYVNNSRHKEAHAARPLEGDGAALVRGRDVV